MGAVIELSNASAQSAQVWNLAHAVRMSKRAAHMLREDLVILPTFSSPKTSISVPVKLSDCDGLSRDGGRAWNYPESIPPGWRPHCAACAHPYHEKWWIT